MLSLVTAMAMAMAMAQPSAPVARTHLVERPLPAATRVLQEVLRRIQAERVRPVAVQVPQGERTGPAQAALLGAPIWVALTAPVELTFLWAIARTQSPLRTLPESRVS